MISTGRIKAEPWLHLRAKATKQSEILANVPNGTVIEIDGQDGNWLHTTYNLKAGYLYKDYVDVVTVLPPDLDQPCDPPRPNFWTKTTSSLAVVIILAILAFAYGSLGWRP